MSKETYYIYDHHLNKVDEFNCQKKAASFLKVTKHTIRKHLDTRQLIGNGMGYYVKTSSIVKTHNPI